MEGNACYKFSTIKNFVEATFAQKISVIVDIGANVGDMSLMMHRYFPEASIIGFEAVKEYFDIAQERTSQVSNISLYNCAVSEQHRFFDDVGEQPRENQANLAIFKGLPEAGPGWIGGSVVVPEEQATTEDHRFGYEKISQRVIAVTLKEIVQKMHIDEIDILKIDCEGCEHSVLGCAEVETLRRVRFIAGEYHCISRFSRVIRKKLLLTHKVNLIGGPDRGCFFAERLNGHEDGILLYDKSGMPGPRPWLQDDPIDWHLFNERFVLEKDRRWHALPPVRSSKLEPWRKVRKKILNRFSRFE